MKISKFYEESTCIKVYDTQTKQVIAVFDNYKKASFGLGVTEKAVNYRTSNKLRFFSPKLNKEVATRISKKEQVAA